MAHRLRPRLLTLFAAASLCTTVCSPSTTPVASTQPDHVNPGGGAGAGGGGGSPDGSIPDGSIPDGSTAAAVACYFCGGSANLDAGCPSNWTETLVTTETGVVCVCENQVGATGCEFCSAANPANGGCDAGACTDICAPGGYFSYCVATGVTVPDECYLNDAG